jgi:bifunctional NMN adenylyltransferase/nudix hydrolase
MSNKKFDYVVFIGRFSPMHIGHQQVIETALEQADNIIILIGSSLRPRTIKNPWTFYERANMILDTIPDDIQSRVHIRPIRDYMYNDDAWINQIQATVYDIVFDHAISPIVGTPTIGLIGHEKDKSSFYLRLFPQWEHINHQMNEVVHATDLRNLLFQQKNFLYLSGLLPESVFSAVRTFAETSEFKALVMEYNFIEKYKEMWKAAPYPPFFITVDTVVIQSGHVLVVVRDAAPGAGLLAIPGGFLEQTEYIECAALRELKEETKIDVPVKVLRGSITNSKVFDHPLRSLRGRTITHTFLIELPPGPLPKVKGSDDARSARWVPFSEIKSEDFFEDHYDQIQFFTGIV